MGLFKKKADPISQRARELQDEIAGLEAKIQKLSSQVSSGDTDAIFRETAPGPVSVAVPSEPVFEVVEQKKLAAAPDPLLTPQIYNEMGVRKFDLPALLRRIKSYFQPKTAANPKLVSYLAAGSIQGLRPLRYEKRVARNRFIFLTGIFLVILWGLVAVFLRR